MDGAGMNQDTVAMAVVVQTMMPADIAGILFTANPASGERSENASFGLGEAVVPGIHPRLPASWYGARLWR